jgi:molecular chaperone HscB
VKDPTRSRRFDAIKAGDHFALFGLERTFDLDLAALEKGFLENSRKLHPDKQLTVQSEESLPKRQQRALAFSAAMNQAYAVLKDRAKRAEYLLKLMGGKSADQDKRTPPGLLEEMLEKRELVAESSSDAREKLNALLAELEGRENETFARLSKLFRAGDTSQIRLELNALKYVTNLIEELRKTLPTWNSKS